MILVTGATGHVGRQVVEGLLAQDVPVRALTRNPATAGLSAGVEVVGGDLARPDTIVPQLAGVDSVFLVWPFTTVDAAPPVLDAIARHARHVVYLSSAGVPDDPAAETDPITNFHTMMESKIRATGLDWTFLRPAGFATNTLGWADQARAGGVVRGPLAALARPLIHERDIAAVAVRALLDDGHAGATHHLTGPALITQDAQVRTIGEAVGRPLRYEEIPLATSRADMAAQWGDADLVDAVLDAWSTMLAHPEPVTDTVERLTGRPPRTFRRWAFDHAPDFS